MSDADNFWRQCDALLRQATATTDLAERSRLISEAVSWNMKAQGAEMGGGGRAAEGAVIPVEPTDKTDDL